MYEQGASWSEFRRQRTRQTLKTVSSGPFTPTKLLVALAEMYEREWAKNHFGKARLAREFYNEGLVSRDIGDFMEELNRMRKDAAYYELETK